MEVRMICASINFYPRSPCGERRSDYEQYYIRARISIHALLAESDLNSAYGALDGASISIHALLAESDSMMLSMGAILILFLSTLSLRRATYQILDEMSGATEHFYPRSPCGERLHYDNYNLHCVEISIHALLAESDLGSVINESRYRHFYPRSPCGERRFNRIKDLGSTLFLSTLSLRRATPRLSRVVPTPIFLSTLSLRRATVALLHGHSSLKFLSTLSLRRATFTLLGTPDTWTISIHALLAESDQGHNERSFVLCLFLSTLSLRRATHFRGPPV